MPEMIINRMRSQAEWTVLAVFGGKFFKVAITTKG